MTFPSERVLRTDDGPEHRPPIAINATYTEWLDAIEYAFNARYGPAVRDVFTTAVAGASVDSMVNAYLDAVESAWNEGEAADGGRVPRPPWWGSRVYARIGDSGAR